MKIEKLNHSDNPRALLRSIETVGEFTMIYEKFDTDSSDVLARVAEFISVDGATIRPTLFDCASHNQIVLGVEVHGVRYAVWMPEYTLNR